MKRAFWLKGYFFVDPEIWRKKKKVTIKMPYRVNVLLHQPPSKPHLFLLILLLDQLRLAYRDEHCEVALISIAAYLYFGFLRPDLSP